MHDQDIVPVFRVRNEAFALADSESALAQRYIDDDVEVSGEQCDHCGCSGYTLGRKPGGGKFYVVCTGDDIRQGCGAEYPVSFAPAEQAVFSW
jgi:hypothetical protein